MCINHDLPGSDSLGYVATQGNRCKITMLPCKGGISPTLQGRYPKLDHFRDITYLDAEVLPRKDGNSGGIFSRTSVGGVTGKCTKWVAARSRICFWSWEKDTRLQTIMLAAFHNAARANNGRQE